MQCWCLWTINQKVSIVSYSFGLLPSVDSSICWWRLHAMHIGYIYVTHLRNLHLVCRWNSSILYLFVSMLSNWRPDRGQKKINSYTIRKLIPNWIRSSHLDCYDGLLWDFMSCHLSAWRVRVHVPFPAKCSVGTLYMSAFATLLYPFGACSLGTLNLMDPVLLRHQLRDTALVSLWNFGS